MSELTDSAFKLEEAISRVEWCAKGAAEIYEDTMGPDWTANERYFCFRELLCHIADLSEDSLAKFREYMEACDAARGQEAPVSRFGK